MSNGTPRAQGLWGGEIHINTCCLGPIYLALLFRLNFLHSLKVEKLLNLSQGVKRGISGAFVHHCLSFQDSVLSKPYFSTPKGRDSGEGCGFRFSGINRNMQDWPSHINVAIFHLSFQTCSAAATWDVINYFIIPPRRPLDRQHEAISID